jgi:two-component system sensor histidine kinase YesM
VTARVVHDVLLVHVSDDGVGMSMSELRSVRRSLHDDAYLSGRHIGLANVHQRITILFGEEYGLSVTSARDAGTDVTVRLPALPAQTGS